MDRLFLDANVLFSAAYREDARLQELWRLDSVELVSSYYALEEARFNLTDSEQQECLKRLSKSVQVIPDLPLGRALPPDVHLPLKDHPILPGAIDLEATHLITGDLRHFGPYFGRRVGGVLVLTPAQYLASRRS